MHEKYCANPENILKLNFPKRKRSSQFSSLKSCRPPRISSDQLNSAYKLTFYIMKYKRT